MLSTAVVVLDAELLLLTIQIAARHSVNDIASELPKRITKWPDSVSTSRAKMNARPS